MIALLFGFYIAVGSADELKVDHKLPLAGESKKVESLSVFGKKESLPTTPGSAYVIDDLELKKFEFNDINRVLRSVPGVNIQEEDGFGLRPNIGLRGAHPHRSRKVTLMEDGVLIAPAPYSAPAAYYFPQMDKIGGVEVFKGTPSARFGPNSIGGAINLVTRSNSPGAEFGYSAGNFGFNKYDMSVGVETYGDVSLDVTRVETTGYKQLPTDANTGFNRDNFTLRWDKTFASMDQNLTAKFNWSDENSNETYAGLTQADFNHNPYQRYAVSELDSMKWNHRQFFLSHAISPIDSLRFRTTAYYHSFDRSWNKFNNFGDGVNPSANISDVLRFPDASANNYFYQIITGQTNSGVLSHNRDVLDLGNNQRQFFSQGIQTNAQYELEGNSVGHVFNLGYRLHQDGIERFHESSFYNMTNGKMVRNNLAARTTELNRGTATAHTATLSYEAAMGPVTANAVTRVEEIRYSEFNRMSGLTQKSGDSIVAPALGLYYQALEKVGFLAGVHKGFTPVGPGQNDNIRPEEALNYEIGVRYTGTVGVELIGFFSDYQNILGTCTLSEGCSALQLDQSFNGGKGQVSGAEFLMNTKMRLRKFDVPLKVAATYTQAQFKSQFDSTLADWGVGMVYPGDPLPYIPEWQGNMMVGLEWKPVFAYFNVNYLGSMPDQAVQVDRDSIDSRVVTDFTVAYNFIENARIKLRVDNITNEKYAVSMRPFGLRPGMPQSWFVGVEYAFR